MRPARAFSNLRRIGLLLPLLIVSSLSCGGADPARRVNPNMPTGTGFVLRELNHSTGRSHRYSLFIPADYRPGRGYPAIVFLHGIGEGGTDGRKCTTVGLGPAIARRYQNFPFIAIFPQVKGNWKGADKADLVIEVLNDAKRHYSIDPTRVSLTGLSTGGEGTWRIGARHRAHFAALVPVCGYAAPDVVDQLTAIPVWCFHNAGDPFVPAGGSKKMCERMARSGGNVRFTQYRALGHNCWDRAYNEQKLYTWLLQQRR